MFCVVAMLMSICATSAPEHNYTHGVYQLKFETKKLSADHVGSDWSITYTCNGQTISSGYQIVYSLD